MVVLKLYGSPTGPGSGEGPRGDSEKINAEREDTDQVHAYI